MPEFDFLQRYCESFLQSELGHIWQKELALAIAGRMPPKKQQSNKPLFPPEGEVALMFLKPYISVSDDALIEMLNGNLYMLMFCGVPIDPSHPI